MCTVYCTYYIFQGSSIAFWKCLSIFIYVFENKNDASELIFYAISSNHKAQQGICSSLCLMFYLFKNIHDSRRHIWMCPDTKAIEWRQKNRIFFWFSLIINPQKLFRPLFNFLLKQTIQWRQKVMHRLDYFSMAFYLYVHI